MPVHVGQSSLDAVVIVSEFFVIEPQQVEHRGMEVRPGQGVDRGPKTEFICFAKGDPMLQSGSRQPDAEALGIMIPPGAEDSGGGLCEWRAAKLGGENQQGVFQHPALFEILDQSGHWLINHRGLALVILAIILVPVPAVARFSTEGSPGKNLHKAGASFEQSPREEATTTAVGRFGPVNPVATPDELGLGGKIGRIWNRCLHPRGEFVGPDARAKQAVTLIFFEVGLVDLIQ